MKHREHSYYQRSHLRKPALLERFFQKESVWLATVILFGALLAWLAPVAALDLLGINDDKDFNTLSDVIILSSVLIVAPFCIQEYRFYRKMLWSRSSMERNLQALPSQITIDDIHMVLDCNGKSEDEIQAEDNTPAVPQIVDLLVYERGVSKKAASDFARHFADTENAAVTNEDILDVFDDTLQHIAIDKNR